MGDGLDKIGETSKGLTEKGDHGSLPFFAYFSALLLTRKTPQWLGDRENSGIRKLGWIPFFAESLSSARSLLLNFLAFVVTCALLLMLMMEMSRTAVTVHPVSVPETLSKNGYTPEVIAARISAELRRITRETRTEKERSNFVERHAEIEFQIPGQLISFRTLVHFARGILGAGNTEIHVDVARDQSNYVAQIRVVGGAYNGYTKIATSPVSVEFDNFIVELSRVVMQAVGPYLLASYEISREDSSCRSVSVKCDYSKAIAILSDLTANPSNPDYKWGLLGQSGVFITLNRFEEAAQSAQLATQFDPGFAQAYANWGAALHASNHEHEAIAKYKKALELRPNYSLVYSVWGLALNRLGRYKEAMAKFEKTLELDPKDDAAYLDLGLSLHNLDRFEEAIAKYKKSLEYNPNQSLAYLNWGLALESIHRHEEAITKYEKALELDPKYDPAQQRIKFLRSKTRIEKAPRR